MPRLLVIRPATRGILTILEKEQPHLRKGREMLPLTQDGRLYSFEVGLGAGGGAPTISADGKALVAEVSSDIRHRQLGHMNSRCTDHHTKMEEILSRSTGILRLGSHQMLHLGSYQLLCLGSHQVHHVESHRTSRK